MTLPVPIEFRLPEGWLPADPESGGAMGVAFAAVHPRPHAGFTANITIDGEYRPDATSLGHLADESVERLREVAESVVVTDRREVGSPDTPALIQRLAFSTGDGDARRDLVQSQVYLSMLDIADSRKRAVVRLALTASPAQHDTVLGDFQDFVRTVRPGTGTEI
ncbi:hypothetical protein [Streptomyces hiroshimensis]|uniref:DUF1795 domain-containing protein n=1 Tax=Streptomyces hiroshimensis TaxID=66424 RepID=A0ABQ2Y6Z3_9ACTN|nr:hypothetical protein [Streptomyces hiroshimensis]GGX68630.1 hypothetical protein GCM10010324_11770 [Streptomyces hiroshimensis]